MNINDLLKIAVKNGASDLHLKVGNPPVIRVDGRLEPLTDSKRLMQEDTSAIALSIMNQRQKQRFKEEMEIDLSYEVDGLGRFRCAIFQQRSAVGLVLLAGRFSTGSLGTIAAGITMAVVPVLIVFVVLQRYIVQSIAASGMKL